MWVHSEGKVLRCYADGNRCKLFGENIEIEGLFHVPLKIPK